MSRNSLVSPLEAQACETQRRLSSPSVFLGQIHSELMEDLTSVARESPKETSVSIHDDETIPVVGLQELVQRLGVELVVTQVERRVDGLEGLKVDIDLLLLAVVGHDRAAVDDEAVGRDLGVELEPLLSGCNCAEHRQPVDS